jgi:hypothetical protein
VRLFSKLGNACVVRYGERTIELRTVRGRAYQLDGFLKA